MSAQEIKVAVLAAWRAAIPMTNERALEIAQEVLVNQPKQRDEFTAWFKKHGATVLQRIGNG